MSGLRLAMALAAAALAMSPLWGVLGASATPPALVPIRGWQITIGRIDGRACPSYPVCSAYARAAIARHGLLLGGWLAIDRLIHEADDLDRGPFVVVDGMRRLDDPLHRNDFWLEAR